MRTAPRAQQPTSVRAYVPNMGLHGQLSGSVALPINPQPDEPRAPHCWRAQSTTSLPPPRTTGPPRRLFCAVPRESLERVRQAIERVPGLDPPAAQPSGSPAPATTRPVPCPLRPPSATDAAPHGPTPRPPTGLHHGPTRAYAASLHGPTPFSAAAVSGPSIFPVAGMAAPSLVFRWKLSPVRSQPEASPPSSEPFSVASGARAPPPPEQSRVAATPLPPCSLWRQQFHSASGDSDARVSPQP